MNESDSTCDNSGLSGHGLLRFVLWSAECGGKNFHFVHKSADLTSVVHHTIRSAFEYSGQKCSACSRLYIAESMWPEFKQELLTSLKDVKVGSPLNQEAFLSAIIDAEVLCLAALSCQEHREIEMKSLFKDNLTKRNCHKCEMCSKVK